MTIEDIIDETGGFGRFQVFIILCICLNRLTIGWSMLQMAYAGFIPEWFCMSFNATRLQTDFVKVCTSNTSDHIQSSDDVSCVKYKFENTPLTIINEWNLVCGLSWVKASVISIQMAGVLVGVILAGFLADCLGKKKTMYLFVLEHAVLNLIAAFSVSWQMFTVCRFFIGLGIGVIIASSFPYPLEFLPIKWRHVVSALPVWSFGIAVFALAGWLMENWSHLHISCGVLSIPGLLGYFYVPESINWLTVQGQLKEAQDVVTKIAVVNRKGQSRKTSIMVQTVVWEEQKARENITKYSFMVNFRKWKNSKITLIFSYHWFSLSLVYYGISFSVSSLAGNLYINIFLLAVVELPTVFVSIFFDNKIGPKWSSVISLVVACAAMLGCVLVQYYGYDDAKTSGIRGLCLTAKLGVGAAWAIVETWGSNVYPTVTRNHSLIVGNISARVGALVAPFLIDLDNMATSSFIVMGCLLLVNIILCILTPATKIGRPAEPSTNVSAVRHVNVHTIDLTNDHFPGNESFTNAIDRPESEITLENVETVLGTIDEETSSNEPDEQTNDNCRENNTNIDTKELTLSKDTTVNSSTTGNRTSEITKSRISRKDRDTESKKGKSSKKPSSIKNPNPKSRKKKMEKIKDNNLRQEQSNSPDNDDAPPYIESEYHKNIRFSIY